MTISIKTQTQTQTQTQTKDQKMEILKQPLKSTTTTTDSVNNSTKNNIQIQIPTIKQQHQFMQNQQTSKRAQMNQAHNHATHTHLSSSSTSSEQSITPIVVALLPSILSSITGHSWMEYVLFSLVLFYLYMILKVPGDLLIQSRSLSSSQQDPFLRKLWKGRESRALALYSLAPVFGGVCLYYTQMLLPTATLLQHFSAILFFLGAFVRPFLYLTGLVTESFLVDMPSSKSNNDHTLLENHQKELIQYRQLVEKLDKRVSILQETLDERVEERCKLVCEPLAKTLHILKKERKKESASIANLASIVHSHKQLHGSPREENVVSTPRDQTYIQEISQKANHALAKTDDISIILETLSSTTTDLVHQLEGLEYRLDTSQEYIYDVEDKMVELVKGVAYSTATQIQLIKNERDVGVGRVAQMFMGWIFGGFGDKRVGPGEAGSE